jgi:hypothetical protein
MSEDEHDNSDVWLFWAVVGFLYLLGTAIWNFGWQTVALVAISIVVVIVVVPSLTILLVRMYLQSEGRHYRIAKRDMVRTIRWSLKKIDQVSRT